MPSFLLIIARKKSNASVRHLHMINVHSSRTVKLDQIHIRLANILIQRKDRDIRVRTKTATNLANLTGRRWWITLDLGTLTRQKSKAKKHYQKCKKECLMLKDTHPEERAIDMASKVNSREESITHAILTMEKVDTYPE